MTDTFPGSHVEELLRALAKIDADLKDDGHQLRACQRSLVATKHFLESIPAFNGGQTRNLDVLAMAIRDTLEGAKPKFLKPKPASRTQRNRGGRPSNESWRSVQGVCAAATETLQSYGLSPEEAAEQVCKALVRYEIRDQKGRNISRKQVVRWRYEANGVLSQVAQAMYNDLTKAFASLSPRPTKEEARAFFFEAIEALASRGFDTPKRRPDEG